MTDNQAIKVLILFNKWRLGGKGKQPDPKEITKAIDFAILKLKNVSTENKSVEFAKYCSKKGWEWMPKTNEWRQFGLGAFTYKSTEELYNKNAEGTK